MEAERTPPRAKLNSGEVEESAEPFYSTSGLNSTVLEQQFTYLFTFFFICQGTIMYRAKWDSGLHTEISRKIGQRPEEHVGKIFSLNKMYC